MQTVGRGRTIKIWDHHDPDAKPLATGADLRIPALLRQHMGPVLEDQPKVFEAPLPGLKSATHPTRNPTVMNMDVANQSGHFSHRRKPQRAPLAAGLTAPGSLRRAAGP